MTKRFFITSSGTNIGKTLVTAALAYQLTAQQKRISVLKPMISGYEPGPDSDTAQLLAAQGLPATIPNIDAVSPWRYAAPLAPHIAAALEGKTIPYDEMIGFCNMPRVSEITLIEGAGGVMTPVSPTHTTRDWIEELAIPAVLVVGTYLGAITHTLTAGEALCARGIDVQAVVVSESAESAMSAQEVAETLKPHLPYARYIVPLPRVAGSAPLWQHMADLTWMLT